jgi:type IV pilus assembly protein PilC
LALKTLESQLPNKRFKEIVRSIYQEVRSGKSFFKTLAQYPHIFSPLFIHMIEAGEMSGNLEEALKQLTTQMRKDYDLRSRVKSALMYPAVVVVAMIVIGFLMMVFVIPRLKEIYVEAGAQLPLPTKILIGTATFLSHNLITSILAIILFLFLLYKLIQTKKGKKIYHKILLKLPILGGIIHKINLARFARTLSSLLKTDIPIVKSFKVISRTLGNVLYQEHLISVTKDLEGGKSIAYVLGKRPDLFPPVVIQMVKIGEKSGTLDELAEELAKFYEEDVTRLTSNLATIIEPILIVLLGGAVALVALSVIMPMYSLVNQI